MSGIKISPCPPGYKLEKPWLSRNDDSSAPLTYNPCIPDLSASTANAEDSGTPLPNNGSKGNGWLDIFSNVIDSVPSVILATKGINNQPNVTQNYYEVQKEQEKKKGGNNALFAIGGFVVVALIIFMLVKKKKT